MLLAGQAVAAVQEVQTDMGRIEGGAQQADSLLRQIAAALEEQASAVEEINANLSSLDRIARSNSAAAEQITATVIELSQLADGTRQEVERFRIAPAASAGPRAPPMPYPRSAQPTG